MDSLAHFWCQQPDVGSAHSNDSYTVFLEAGKTDPSPFYPNALYYGHHDYRPDYKSSVIPCRGEYALTLHQPYYAWTNYMDDY